MSKPPVPYGVHGVFTRALAESAGWTRRQSRNMVETGQWKRAAGRAFAPRGLTIGARELAAAALLTWPRAVISHELAGVLWGFPALRSGPAVELATVTVPANMVLRGHRLRPIGTTCPLTPGPRPSG